MADPPDEAPTRGASIPYRPPEAEVGDVDAVRRERLDGCSFLMWLFLPLVSGAGGCLVVGALTSSREAVSAYGLIQLIYVVPLCLSAYRSGTYAKLAALVIGAAIVFLVSATCGRVM